MKPPTRGANQMNPLVRQMLMEAEAEEAKRKAELKNTVREETKEEKKGEKKHAGR